MVYMVLVVKSPNGNKKEKNGLILKLEIQTLPLEILDAWLPLFPF